MVFGRIGRWWEDRDKRAELDQRNAIAKSCFQEVKADIERHFPFLFSTFGFAYAYEEYLGRNTCAVFLENEFARIAFAAGAMQDMTCNMGGRSEALAFEAPTGWKDVLSLVNEKLGHHEAFPDSGRHSWEPYPHDLAIETYQRLLRNYLPQLLELFRRHGTIDRMPDVTRVP